MKNVSTSVESQGELLVIPNVEPNVEESTPTYDIKKAKTIEPTVNMHVSSTQMDTRSCEFKDENSQPEKNMESEDNGNPLGNLFNKISR